MSKHYSIIVFCIALIGVLFTSEHAHAAIQVSKIQTTPDGVYADVSVGARAVTLLSFDITSQNDTARIRFFTFNVNGKKDDIKNVKLKEGNRSVAEMTVVDSNPFTIAVPDVRIDPGQKKSFSIVADISNDAFGNIVSIGLTDLRFWDEPAMSLPSPLKGEGRGEVEGAKVIDGLPIVGPEFKVSAMVDKKSPAGGQATQNATLSGITREPSRSQFESGEEVTLVWSVLGDQAGSKIELSLSCPADVSVVAERVSCSNAVSVFDVTGRNAFSGKLINSGTKTQKISFTLSLIVNKEKKAVRTTTVSVKPEKDRPIIQFGLLGGADSVISGQKFELVWETRGLRKGEQLIVSAKCPTGVSFLKMLGFTCNAAGKGFDVTKRKRLYGVVENKTQKTQTITVVLKSVFEKKTIQKELKITVAPPGGKLTSSLTPGSLVKSLTGSTVYYVNGDGTISPFSDRAMLKAYGFESKPIGAYDLSQAVVGDVLLFPDGAVVKIFDGQVENRAPSSVFVVDGVMVRPVVSADVYQVLYRDPEWKLVNNVSYTLIQKLQYSLGPAIATASDRVMGSNTIKRLKK